MNILITGGTGFIGSALCSYLLDLEHDVVVLSRFEDPGNGRVKTITRLEQPGQNAYYDVVVNLAGEPIANKRWTQRQKERIINSRVEITKSLLEHIGRAETKPELLISGSAIGYYGVAASDEPISEGAAGDDSFSSRLCKQWEEQALQAESMGIRTCLLRTGIVLGKSGGALQRMLLPFRFGLGGKIGNGEQWMPWIHLADLINIIVYCIENKQLKGPVNGTAPNPVKNKEFTKTLGAVLNRPTLLPMPGFIIKLLMGQMGEELLLSGKRVLPEKVVGAGYQFQYKSLDKALLSIL
ncbi:MAG: TIGR01777 family oxidoreductase [Gammaproteobacteria bacterium]|nr:TIGR01777 family oxidoreductase [Gammaproteobacteria bacterium]MBT8150368.1 TIGR01777 family oxidoreductase [Gammaproteobacteria bacterium]NNM11416.1 TIGR01777 family protein [Pseudomonadales bacterium]RZV51777.1 MAG: TIGR01777 family protein [Pseudomonadales bacterium]